MSQVSSQITFLYFKDYENSCKFFSEFLGFPTVLQKPWCRIWQTSPTSFVGAVDVSQRELHFFAEEKGNLVSFNVESDQAVFELHRKLSEAGYEVRPITFSTQIEGLRAFFAVGPEGYHFEFEHFSSPEWHAIFHG